MEQAFYSIPEVSKRLGIGETKVREMVTSGAIPSVRLADARILRIPATSLEKFIADETKRAEQNKAS